jgi:uncharacterized membrane protein
MKGARMVSPLTESVPHIDIPDPHPEFVLHSPDAPNVGEMERTLSVLAGSLLLTSALRHFDVKSLALTYLGYRLLKRGATGQCPLYTALNITSRLHTQERPAG